MAGHPAVSRTAVLRTLGRAGFTGVRISGEPMSAVVASAGRTAREVLLDHDGFALVSLRVDCHPPARS
ncbi:MAG: hypothetical protein ACYDH5_10315 [Acidimicrobiales bacterium]